MTARCTVVHDDRFRLLRGSIKDVLGERIDFGAAMAPVRSQHNQHPLLLFFPASLSASLAGQGAS